MSPLPDSSSKETNRVRSLRSGVVAQAVLEVTDTLVVVLDVHGMIRLVNPACEALTRYSADQLEGERAFDLLVPEYDRPGVRTYWSRLLEGTAPTTCRNHWTVKEGAPRYITWSNTVVEAADGTRYVVATGMDITERQQLERDVVRVSESERRRIGQELHDTFASDLVAAAMKLDNLRSRVESEHPQEGDLLQRLEDIEGVVRQAGKRARSLSHLLAAGDLSSADLPAALSLNLSEPIGSLRMSIANSRCPTKGSSLRPLDLNRPVISTGSPRKPLETQ